MWKCSTSSGLDSNFFSTAGQTLLGFLSIYCLVVPILGRDKEQQPDIPVSKPLLFRLLLYLGTLLVLLAVPVYPFQPQVALALGFVGAVLPIVATLMLIRGSTSKIRTQRERMDNLEGDLTNVRSKAGSLEGRVAVLKAENEELREMIPGLAPSEDR